MSETRPWPSLRKAGPVALFSLVAAAYVLVGWIGAARTPIVWEKGDSAVFLEMARLPWRHPAMVAGLRPPVVPMLYSLFLDSSGRVNVPAVRGFQTILSAISWLALAACLARVLATSWLRIPAFCLVLLSSLAPDVQYWNSAILGESVSNSLLALVVAGWLWAATIRDDWKSLSFLGLVSVLFLFSKDVNAYPMILTGLLLVPLVVWKKLPARYTWLAGAIGVSFVLIGQSAERVSTPPSFEEARPELSRKLETRWFNTMMNLFGERIIPFPDRLEYFARCGAPVNAALLGRSGKWGQSDDWAFLRDPELEGFRRWLKEDGKGCYERFLLTHPSFSLGELARETDTILFPMRKNRPLEGPVVSRLPLWVAHAVYPSNDVALVALGVAASICVLVACLAWPPRKVLVVPAVLVLLTLPQAFIGYHGDSMDVERHCLGAALGLRLGLLLLVVLSLDSRLSGRSCAVATPGETAAG